MKPTCRPGKKCGLTCCEDGQVCKSNMFCQEKGFYDSSSSSSSSEEEFAPCGNDNDCSRFERCMYPSIFRMNGYGTCTMTKWFGKKK